VSTITIGTAPDSWGVWFPSDPEQVPPEVFLREVADAGYEWIELGPYGYLPSDAAKLSEQLDEYGLGVLAGTVFEHLHRPDSWDDVWTQVTNVAALTEAVGGKHIVVIPEVWRHHKTGYQPDIERLLDSTNPEWVNLCFDTGHIAYYGGDCLELIRKYPDRIGYLHLKQINPQVVAQVLDKDLSFPEAVRMGAMIEPPLGVPEMPPLLDAVSALDRDIEGIIEHDLYPCSPDLPLPIAKRTKTYLSSCSGANIEFGRQR
jgi:inosose dehydratase